MSEISNPRRVELVELIQHALYESNDLQSYSKPNQRIAKSAWGQIAQFLQLCEQHFHDETEKKSHFTQWVNHLPDLPGDKKVNVADLKKVRAFLLQPELQALTIQEMKYVVGWIQRLS